MTNPSRLRILGGTARGRKLDSPEVYLRPMMGKVSGGGGSSSSSSSSTSSMSEYDSYYYYYYYYYYSLSRSVVPYSPL